MSISDQSSSVSEQKGQPKKGRLVIVIGQSGSGHSTALDCLEDAGFSSVDNIPLALVDQLVALAVETEGKDLAISADLRTSGFDHKAIERLVLNLKGRLFENCVVVLIRAHSDEILRRYQATRRRHPLLRTYQTLEQAIEADRVSVSALSFLADLEIDSTERTPTELRKILQSGLRLDATPTPPLTIFSFSYRKGLPPAADFIFDMRFLNNPHWHKDLREKTGLDHKIQEFVANDPAFLPFMQSVSQLLQTAWPRLVQDGRSQITIGFGCTGGRHRSVAAAQWLAGWAESQNIASDTLHRELRQALQ